jgi:formate/nitrite transporter FocA (FNT family)
MHVLIGDVRPRDGFSSWSSWKMISRSTVAVTMARSELFTENFLIPVATVVAREGTLGALGRLWISTLATNLVAGWLVAALIVAAFPSLRATAVESANDHIHADMGWSGFALALLAGMLVTLMTHLQHTTTAVGARLVPAVIVGFLLAVGHFNHSVVASIFCFAAFRRWSAFRIRPVGTTIRHRYRRQSHRRPRPSDDVAADAGAPQGR